MSAMHQATLFDPLGVTNNSTAHPAAAGGQLARSARRQPPYKRALGLTVGDWVQRQDRTAPAAEITSIWGPYWWWSDYHAVYCYGSPTISLTLQLPGVDPGDRPITLFMNTIQRAGERWLMGPGDVVGGSPYFGPRVHPQGVYNELVLIRRGDRQPDLGQAALLDEASAWVEPYPRVPGVRYDGGDRSVWTCVSGRGLGWPEGVRCTDFNSAERSPHCPTCGRGGSRRIYVFCPPPDDEAVLL